MSKIIDLSHTIHMNMPVYPGTKAPEITEICSIQQDGFKESLISFYSHIGTHIDVPAHLLQNGNTVDSFDCNCFFGTAILIDCRNKKNIELKTVSEVYNRSESPDFIIFYTGWGNWWGTDQYFRDFPVLTNEAAEYIASLPLKGLGIDAISYDPVGDSNLSNHRILMKENIIMVENLCSLDRLIENQFMFSCLPLNIKGADGAPCRSFAILT